MRMVRPLRLSLALSLALSLPILLLPLALLTAIARADDRTAAAAMIRYDADSTTLTYCRMEGQQGAVTLSPVSGAGRVKTSGSSTTVSSETAATSALAPVLARDVVFVRPTTSSSQVEPFAAGYAAVVTVKTDADTVTVDPAVNWPGQSYTYLHTVCGTDANAGWIDTANAERIALTIQYDQGDLDNLSWHFQCKQSIPGQAPQTVYPSEGDGCGNAGIQASGLCDFAAAGAASNFTWEEFGTWSACRIGFKVKTTDTSEAGANLERVTGSIIVGRQR